MTSPESRRLFSLNYFAPELSTTYHRVIDVCKVEADDESLVHDKQTKRQKVSMISHQQASIWNVLKHFL